MFFFFMFNVLLTSKADQDWQFANIFETRQKMKQPIENLNV